MVHSVAESLPNLVPYFRVSIMIAIFYYNDKIVRWYDYTASIVPLWKTAKGNGETDSMAKWWNGQAVKSRQWLKK